MKPIPEITIEVSKKELEAMIESLNCFKYHLPITRKAKATRSALYDTYKKLNRKLLTKPKKNKRYSLKLKYHEADYLDKYLDVSQSLQFDHFCQSFRVKILEKLA